jgi:hypothetical protein
MRSLGTPKYWSARPVEIWNDELTYHIEQSEVLLLLYDIAQLFPLILRRVDTRWVLRTSM